MRIKQLCSKYLETITLLRHLSFPFYLNPNQKTRKSHHCSDVSNTNLIAQQMRKTQETKANIVQHFIRRAARTCAITIASPAHGACGAKSHPSTFNSRSNRVYGTKIIHKQNNWCVVISISNLIHRETPFEVRRSFHLLTLR